MSNTAKELATFNSFLQRMEAICSEKLAEVDRRFLAEHDRLTKEIRILDSAITDARRTRRFRIAEALLPKQDGLIRQLSSLRVAEDRAKATIRQEFWSSTAKQRLEAKRLQDQVNTTAAMARQREMQLRRYRPIPVMR